MLNQENLKSLLSKPELSRKHAVLLLLAFSECSIKSVSELKALGSSNGLRRIEKWNVSQILKDLGGWAVRLNDGWEITPTGLQELINAKLLAKGPLATASSNLRKYLDSIPEGSTKEFIKETISALEYGLLRSAVVLSWVGALSILYEYTVNHKIADFNAEATRRDAKWKTALNQDDLCKMKEFNFLEILEGISVIGKNCKKELQNCLALRNSCGHPNTLVVGENMVAAHIEMLILNVYTKFSP